MSETLPRVEQPQKTIRWRLWLRGGLLLLLCALCGFGLIATPVLDLNSFHYWGKYVLPTFAVVTIILGGLPEAAEDRISWIGVVQLLFHWLGVMGATYLIFSFAGDFITADIAGPIVIVLLALSTYLAGIYFDKLLIPLSIVIAGIAVGTVWLENNVLLVILMCVALLGVAGLIVWLTAKGRGRQELPATSENTTAD